MSFQRFLAGIAAVLLLLPTACSRQDDAQAPVVDNLGTVLSPSNSLIREPANSSVNGTLKSTYEYLRLIDGHDLPDDDGYAHDHLVAALRPYLVNGGDSRQAHVNQLMAASSLKTLNALSDKERSEVDKRTRLPKGCITRKSVMTDLPIATIRREIGLTNDGLCLTPWKVAVTDYTTSSEDARWAMQALASADLFGNVDDVEGSGWKAVADGYLRHLDTYSGPGTTIAMALSAADTVSALSRSQLQRIGDRLTDAPCPRKDLGPALIRNGKPVKNKCSIESAYLLRYSGNWAW
ncbi:hypothetical protein E5345_01520 [Propionibacterium sp. NM47_B9-13]|jgi:hypothetical protein|uniref:Lipoprotein n=1 Tax=Cutibacterium modestum HL044PA1 TaxID=765109 RepID=A0ABP2K3T5_9ACTN|nr:hypothetical protein [Cutibacterium modestum]TGY29989.1 hypothetical protein E5345_01520 [Propionibacterium sp. NM47_B9-13]EFS73931.1 hypothetical protein HMPREF9621_01770 [Cutibacterium modestum HL037PA2]EFS91483.1 hypothetical protein HMPREF9607_02392 [Cutibacterium modestum HL044PA1]MCP2376851.1 hypothetical protein [Cutibacterium modestum 28N]REB73585.1 hypothetical protein CP877_08395 [Cutibacterium modestum]